MSTCGECLYLGYLNHCSRKGKIVKRSWKACRGFEPKHHQRVIGHAKNQPYRPVILYINEGLGVARFEADIKRRKDLTVITVPVAIMRKLGLKKGERIRVSIQKIRKTKWKDVPEAKEALAAIQRER